MIEATIRDAVGSMSHSMVHDLAVTIQKGLQKEDQKSVAAAAASFPPKRKIAYQLQYHLLKKGHENSKHNQNRKSCQLQ